MGVASMVSGLRQVASEPKQLRGGDFKLAQHHAPLLDLDAPLLDLDARLLDLIGTRTTAINLIWTSLGSNLSYCQGLCDNNPSQALVLADASGYHVSQVGTPVRPLIGITLDIGLGTAHLKANAAQFPAPSGKPSAALTWLWRHSIDGGKTIVVDDPTPTGTTTITGLPLGVQVNVSAAVKDRTGTGPWSMWIPVFVH